MSGVNVLRESVQNAEEAVVRVYRFAQSFEAEFTVMVRDLVEVVGEDKAGNIIICSIYNPAFEPFNVTTVSQDAANMCVALLADAILRVATRFGLPVIDWRRVMTEATDFANPIEPSSNGGHKMAEAISVVMQKHPFHLRATVVYPQHYPDSQFASSTSSTNAIDSAATQTAHATNIADVASSAAAVADIRETGAVL